MFTVWFLSVTAHTCVCVCLCVSVCGCFVASGTGLVIMLVMKCDAEAVQPNFCLMDTDNGSLAYSARTPGLFMHVCVFCIEA